MSELESKSKGRMTDENGKNYKVYDCNYMDFAYLFMGGEAVEGISDYKKEAFEESRKFLNWLHKELGKEQVIEKDAVLRVYVPIELKDLWNHYGTLIKIDERCYVKILTREIELKDEVRNLNQEYKKTTKRLGDLSKKLLLETMNLEQIMDKGEFQSFLLQVGYEYNSEGTKNENN